MLKQLRKQLHTIEPDPEFKKRSFALIVHTPQKKLATTQPAFAFFFRALQFSGALGLAGLLFFLLLHRSPFLTNQPSPSSALTDLNPTQLEQEAQNLDIQIRLSEATYTGDAAARVEVAHNGTAADSMRTQTDDLLDALIL